MRNMFAARLFVLLAVFVLPWLPACSGMMDKEKAMMEKSGGTMAGLTG